jgi:hypothetical protein
MIGGQQAVSLKAGGCTYAGTTAHELTHALGLLSILIWIFFVDQFNFLIKNNYRLLS